MIVLFRFVPLGGEMLDLKFGYSQSELVHTLAMYTERGRSWHVFSSAFLDTLFPLLYVTFFTGVLWRYRPIDRFEYFALVPIFAGALDLLENAQIIKLLIDYPEISSLQVAVASFFTKSKHILGFFYQGGALIFLSVSFVKTLFGMARGGPRER